MNIIDNSVMSHASMTMPVTLCIRLVGFSGTVTVKGSRKH